MNMLVTLLTLMLVAPMAAAADSEPLPCASELFPASDGAAPTGERGGHILGIARRAANLQGRAGREGKGDVPVETVRRIPVKVISEPDLRGVTVVDQVHGLRGRDRDRLRCASRLRDRQHGKHEDKRQQNPEDWGSSLE